ncbi:sensor domain-containing diguanylate cyclase [Roseibium aggregatum]|uniref:diguanylate cyclase n=1 Tax=Roseibium aggregatum TaxID=187304 RepID=A0A926P5J0_9HYPH|nr:diguanylate cyclase [Roseibium aggregatum]MBD1548381.1 diguanylate cyclase [Roseibium aggregatum]
MTQTRLTNTLNPDAEKFVESATPSAEKAPVRFAESDDGLLGAIVELDSKGRCVFINDLFASWFGKPREDLLGTRIRDALPSDSRNRSEPYYQRALKGEHVCFETKKRYPTGITREVRIEYSPKLNASGDQTGVIIYSTDITERNRTERTLADLYAITSTRELTTDQKIEQILKLGCDHFELPFGVISRIIEDHYTVTHAESPNGEIMAGASFALGATYCSRTLDENAPLAIDHASMSEFAGFPCYEKFALEAYIGAPVFVDGDTYGTINFTAPEPRERPFSKTGRELIRQFADSIGNEIARQQDHDALMEARIRLEQVASNDDLTGVLNRRAFLERAETELARFHQTGRKFTAVTIDVDDFKSINDTYGHSVGDEVLKGIAELFSESLRPVDVFGRIGGEEFCAILDDTEEHDALMTCNHIQKNVIRQFKVEPVTGDITCSMGLATVTAEDSRFSELLQRADQALYRARKAGRSRCLAYRPEVRLRMAAG